MKFLLTFLAGCFFCLWAESPQPRKQQSIAFCVVATGKYLPYAQSLVNSARVHFCRNHKVSFFVFTDGELEKGDDVHRVEIQGQGWPMDSLKRNHYLLMHKNLLKGFDFIFIVDADMLFVASVSDEILSDLVAVQDHLHIGKRGAYEKNRRSTAFVDKDEGAYYFVNRFYGGKKQRVFQLLEEMVAQIDEDLKMGYIARAHDESHLNRYFINHPPSLILSPGYAYPENWNLPYPKKIISLERRETK